MRTRGGFPKGNEGLRLAVGFDHHHRENLMAARNLLGKAHKPSLDAMSNAQIRVVCEHLLFTMQTEQRRDLIEAFPGLYKMVFPDHEIVWEDRRVRGVSEAD
jgi:hypothetical protein